MLLVIKYDFTLSNEEVRSMLAPKQIRSPLDLACEN